MIVIIIICFDIYLRYWDDKPSINNEYNSIHYIKDPNPWIKIVNDDLYTKYYIKINNFNAIKFIEWNKITNKLKYDKDNNNLIIRTKTEEEALALTNLFISNMNNDIELNEIIENNLINLSKSKASNKLVKRKIIDFIKTGISVDSSKKSIMKNQKKQLSLPIDTFTQEAFTQEPSTKEILLNELSNELPNEVLKKDIFNSIEPIHNVEPIYNVESSRDVKTLHNVESSRDVKSVHDVESLHNVESLQDVESLHNVESLQDVNPSQNKNEFLVPYGGSEYANIQF